MAYALIPDGYSLKKVTKLQKQAVNDHRRHEDVKTFLGNETTPILIGGIAIATLTPALITIFLALLREQGVTVNDAQKAGIEGALRAIGPVGWTVLLAQKAREDGLPDLTKFWKVV